MEIGEIFKDSLKCPAKNWKMVLIIGVLYIVSNISSIFHLGQNTILGIVFGIISIIVGLIIGGYGISIIKNSIDNKNEIPSLDPVDNIINGIKFLVTSFVYYIIPTIITIIIALLTGVFGKTAEIINPILTNQTIMAEISKGGTTSLTNYLNTIFADLLGGLGIAVLITVIIGAILFIIFSFLLAVAQARLADTGSLVESIKITEMFNLIGKIGWAKFILWIIALYVLYFFISFITGLILSLIPLNAGLIAGTGGLDVGLIIISIISSLVISPYILLFRSRALGLLYQDVK